MRASAWLGSALVVWFWAGKLDAQADHTHYQALLVGDRSMGMGTAFTGLASDGSAVFFNPGGLSFQERAAITGGLWLNAFDRREVDGGMRRDFGQADLLSQRIPSYPAFAASSHGVGKRDPEGRRRFVVALSSFRRRTEEFVARTRLVDAASGGEQVLDLERSDRSTYYGLTLGWRGREGIGTGLSLFLARRTYNQQEVSFTTSARLNGGQPNLGSARNGKLRINGYSFVIRWGWLKKLSSRVNVGLMVQSPGIPLKIRATHRHQRLDYDLAAVPPLGSYESRDEGSLKALSPIPMELRVGTAYHFGKRWTWTHDLGLVAPVLNRSVLVGAAPRTEPLGLFVDASTARTPVANVATGFEVRAMRKLVVRVGAFTDFSAARRIPLRTESFRSDRIHIVGFTGSIGIRGRDRGLALGVSGTLGRGQALAAVLGNDAELSTYERTDARSRTIFLSVTGGVEVAQKLVKKVTDDEKKAY